MAFKFFKKKSKNNQITTKQVSRNGFQSFFLGNNTPVYISTRDFKDYERIVRVNPVAYSTIDILSRYIANAKVKLKDLKTGEIISQEDMLNPEFESNEIIKKAFNLFEKPNPLQSSWEFLRSYLFFKKTFGNAFIYANKPTTFPVNIENVQTLVNVWPRYMNVVLRNQYFTATKVDEIIGEWRLEYINGLITKFSPDEILHRKEVNLSLNSAKDLVFGRSILESLSRPLSNIEIGYESENIVLKNRGSRFVVSPTEQNEFNRGEPLDKESRETLEESFGDYGFLEGQKLAIVSPVPVNVNVVDQDIRKLGIFESIANNALVVANAFGVPEILLKLYIQGATFENQKESVKRMYQDTVIPEFTDFIRDLNDFLKMKDFGYIYIPSFDHISVLQEDFRERAMANRQISAFYKEQFFSGAATLNEWRRALNQPESDWGDVRIFDLTPEQQTLLNLNIPIVSNTNEDLDPAESERLQAQANLKGTVGGVQGILEIQSSVAQGITQYDAGLVILQEIYGFSDETAKSILGEPQNIQQQEPLNQTQDGD